MKRKKILYFSDCFFFAGCENMIVNFVNSKQLNDKYDVQFMYRYSNKYEAGMKKRLNTLKTIPVNLNQEISSKRIVTSDICFLRYMQKCLWAILYMISKYWCIVLNTVKLHKAFKKIDFDILHINNGGYPAASSCYSATIAGRLTGHKNIVYVVNNMAEGYIHPFRWFDWLIDKYMERMIKVFITGSDNAGRRLEKVLNIRRKRITIHNGIQKREITSDKDSLKHKLGITSGQLVFSTVANLEKRKGHIYLFKAIKELVAEQPNLDTIFLIEGKGPCQNELLKYIEDNHLEKYIKMINIKNIYDLYNITDVFILPSICNEDFPNTIIESMSLGIPVISTKIAGIPEQIVEGKTGFLLPPKDHISLRDAIIKLIDNEELRLKMSINAKIRFENEFTAEISVNNYLNLYNKMV